MNAIKKIVMGLAVACAATTLSATTYTAIEYVEGTTAGHIDTGIYPDSTTYVQLDFVMAKTTGEQFFGTSKGGKDANDKNKYWKFFGYLNGWYLDIYCGNPNGRANTTTGWSATARKHFEFGNCYIKDLGTGSTLASHTPVADFGDLTDTLWIFGSKETAGEEGKIYGCKIFKQGEMVRDLVPVKDKDGVTCLLDLVSGGLFYGKDNALTAGPETGTVTYPQDVPPENPEVTSIELSVSTAGYDGLVHKPTVAVYSGGTPIGSENYEIDWGEGNWTDAGEYTVTVSGTNGGEKSATFTITPYPEIKVSCGRYVLQTGSDVEAGVIVQSGAGAISPSVELVKGRDYTLAYSPETPNALGDYTVTVAGIGNYAGAAVKTMTGADAPAGGFSFSVVEELPAECPTNLSPATTESNPIDLLSAAQKDYLYTKTVAERRTVAASGAQATLFCYGSPVTLSWEGTTGSCTVRVKRAADQKTVCEETVDGTSVTIYNLELGAEYEWTVVSEDSGLSSSATFWTSDLPPRLIRAGQMKMLRDLGGWTGLQGCKIRQNLIFRGGAADIPSTGEYLLESDADRAFFYDVVGLRNEIDFRDVNSTDDVAASSKASGLYKFDPSGDHVVYNNYPLADCNLLPTIGSFPNALKQMMDTAELPAYFHCKSGRDRTGSCAAVLLAVLGVSRDDIVRDYQTTSDKDKFVMDAESTTHGGFGLFIDETLASYENADLSLAENARAYLLDCGITSEQIETFRETMLIGYVPQEPPIVAKVTGANGPANGTAYSCALDVTDPADGYTALWAWTDAEDFTHDAPNAYDTEGVYTNIVKVTKSGYIDFYGTGVVTVTSYDPSVGPSQVTIYTALEYVEGTDAGCIDTGIYPDSTTYVQLEFVMAKATGNSFFGADGDAWRFFAYQKGWYFDIKPSRANTTTGWSATARKRFEFGNCYIKDLDTGATLASHTPVADFGDLEGTLCVFAASGDEGKIYGCKIFKQGEMVRDLVPVKDKDGVTCLLDLVSGELFYGKDNALTAGPETGTVTYPRMVVAKVTGATGPADGRSYSCALNVTDPADGYTELWAWTDTEDFTHDAPASYTEEGSYTNLVKVTADGYADFIGTGVVTVTSYDPSVGPSQVTTYTALEYVEWGGASANKIDTLISPDSTTYVQLDFVMAKATGGNFFGMTVANNFWRFFAYQSGWYCDILDDKTGRVNTGTGWSATARKHFEFGNRYIKDLDTGATLASKAGSDFGDLSGTLSIFDGEAEVGKIYGCKIFKQGEMVRNLVPVKDKDGVTCLLDLVSGGLFYGKNNALTAGPETGIVTYPPEVTSIELSVSTAGYDGLVHKPTVSVYSGGTPIGSENYEIDWGEGNWTDAGEYTVTVSGTNGGEKSATFTITPYPEIKVSCGRYVLQTGSDVEAGVIVQSGAGAISPSVELVKGRDYTLAYSPATPNALGDYTVTVAGIGNYAGAAVKTMAGADAPAGGFSFSVVEELPAERPTNLSPATTESNPIDLLSAAQKDYLYTKTVAERRTVAASGAQATLFCYGSPVTLSWEGTTGSCTVRVKRAADQKTVCEETVDGTSVTIYNLELGAEYEWTVVSEDSGLSSSATFWTSDLPPRLIRAGQMKMLRDLGGWTGLQGCKIRQNLIFRGGAADLPSTGEYLLESDADRAFFYDVVGLKNEIDFRDPNWPSDFAASSRASGLYKFDPTGERVTYNNYPTTSSNLLSVNGAFPNAFRLLMNSLELPAYFHCKLGRDRTGTCATVLLAVLGVSSEDIKRDYQATSDMSDRDYYPEFDNFLDVMLATYKSKDLSLAENARAYLLDCGITSGQIETFRETMLIGYVPQDPQIVAKVTGASGPANGTAYSCALDVTDPADGYTALWAWSDTEDFTHDAPASYAEEGSYTNLVKVTADGYLDFCGTGVVTVTSYDPSVDPGQATTYTAIEYVKGTTAGHIDTGIYPDSTTYVQLDFVMEKATGEQFFGTSKGGKDANDKNKYWKFFGYLNGWYLDIYCGNPNGRAYTTTGWSATARKHFELGNCYIKDLGTGSILASHTPVADFGDLTDTLWIFGSKETAGEEGKIYGCKIFKQGEMVRDLVPVKDKDGVTCLLDLVSGELFYGKDNALTAGPETGTVTYPQDVPPEDEQSIVATVTGASGPANGTAYSCALSVTDPNGGWTAKWAWSVNDEFTNDVARVYTEEGVYTNLVKVTAEDYLDFYGTGVVTVTSSSDDGVITALTDEVMAIFNQVNPIVSGRRKFISLAYITDTHKCKRTAGDTDPVNPVTDYWYHDEAGNSQLVDPEPSIRLLGSVAASASFDGLIHAGDFSTAIPQKRFDEGDYLNEIRNVKAMVSTYLPNTPFFAVDGNHDRNYTNATSGHTMTDDEWGAVLAEINTDVSENSEIVCTALTGNSYTLDFKRCLADGGKNIRLVMASVFDTNGGSDPKARMAEGLVFGNSSLTPQNTVVGVTAHDYRDAFATAVKEYFNQAESVSASFFGAITGHRHQAATEQISGMAADHVVVKNAFAPMGDTSRSAYHFAIFVFDTERNKMVEIRLAGGAANSPQKIEHNFAISELAPPPPAGEVSRLEWIQCSGEGDGAYFDTNFVPDPMRDKIEIVVTMTDLTRNQFLFGARSGNDSSVTSAWAVQLRGSTQFRYDYNKVSGTTKNCNLETGVQYTFTAEGNTLTWSHGDGIVSSEADFSPASGPLKILWAESAPAHTSCKLHSFRIWRDGQLIHEFLPTMLSSGEVTLLDYGSSPISVSRCGTFQAGPVIPPPEPGIKVGDNLTATFENGVCTISGTGAMWDGDALAELRALAITNLVIGEGITSISASAFEKMRSIHNVTIGSTVTNIGQQVFHKCYNLTNIVILTGATAPTVGEYAFFRCNSLVRITVMGDSSVNWGDKAFTLQAGIRINSDTGLPDIYPIPEIVDENGYVTVLYGTNDLNGDWTKITSDADRKNYHFFKIVIEEK